MHRALFEKTGNAVYISHLDLMRLFQRSFKRASLRLTHTQGFSPKPSVSIALPMSVGVESACELLDFDLEDNSYSYEEIAEKLNNALTQGVRVLQVYPAVDKIKNIALLDCAVVWEYDQGIPQNAEEQISALFSQPSLLLDKKGKNGLTQQDIVPMIRQFSLSALDEKQLMLTARICCQNPSLNPAQFTAAVERYLPELTPDFARYYRKEIYRADETIFR